MRDPLGTAPLGLPGPVAWASPVAASVMTFRCLGGLPKGLLAWTFTRFTHSINISMNVCSRQIKWPGIFSHQPFPLCFSAFLHTLESPRTDEILAPVSLASFSGVDVYANICSGPCIFNPLLILVEFVHNLSSVCCIVSDLRDLSKRLLSSSRCASSIWMNLRRIIHCSGSFVAPASEQIGICLNEIAL